MTNGKQKNNEGTNDLSEEDRTIIGEIVDIVRSDKDSSQ